MARSNMYRIQIFEHNSTAAVTQHFFYLGNTASTGAARCRAQLGEKGSLSLGAGDDGEDTSHASIVVEQVISVRIREAKEARSPFIRE